MSFAPVSTLEDLDSLPSDEIVEGYRSFEKGDPEPGENRGKAYWHGWMNAARDHHERPSTPEAAALCSAYLERERNARVRQRRSGPGRGAAPPP